MNRRRMLALLGASLPTAAAGCLGDEDDEADQLPEDDTDTEDEPGEDEDGQAVADDEDGEPAAEEFPREEMGAVRESSVDGLEVVGWQSSTDGRGDFEVEVRVHNHGDESVELMEYEYELSVADEGGRDVTGDTTGTLVPGGGDPDPDEVGTVVLFTDLTTDPADVASYEFSIKCDIWGDGVYCD